MNVFLLFKKEINKDFSFKIPHFVIIKECTKVLYSNIYFFDNFFMNLYLIINMIYDHFNLNNRHPLIRL